MSGPNPTPPADRLDASAVTRLLQLGLDGPRRPVDALIDRLDASGGGAWLDRSLERLGVGHSAEAADAVRAMSVADLSAFKDRAKIAMRDAIGEDDRLCGLLGYMLSLAGALAVHGTSISSRGAIEQQSVLLDLGAALPGTLGELVADGAMRVQADA
ncbi:MAG: hypothetical protein H6811_00760 [Phycisphaeraceae bacterium]|nr:hypothetical protein [Phycisphaeraceae bacterium]